MKRLLLALGLAAGIAAPAVAQTNIGFIYVGPAADVGYNMSMDLGRLFVEQNVPGVTTTAFENVPETAEVTRVMERLIAGGASIVFATSYGYLDYAIELGERYPNVAFLHAGGLRTSSNVGVYWADSDQGMYLAGVTAASVSQTGKLGFIGGFAIPQLFRSVNAFTMGARSVNPEATTTVIWNGAWWDPQKEAEAVNAMADQGIDVIAEQVDSPITVAETAQRRGVYVIGKDVDIHDRVPDVWLTGVSWNWGPMMADLVTQIQAGTWTPSMTMGDLASGTVVLDPFGAAVPADVQAAVLTMKDEFIAGTRQLWAGPIIRQDGTVAAAEGATLTPEEVGTMNFLVQGVIGATQ